MITRSEATKMRRYSKMWLSSGTFSSNLATNNDVESVADRTLPNNVVAVVKVNLDRQANNVSSVIFVTKIKTRTRIIGLHFQKTRTTIIVIQKTKTK